SVTDDSSVARPNIVGTQLIAKREMDHNDLIHFGFCYFSNLATCRTSQQCAREESGGFSAGFEALWRSETGAYVLGFD
ncbi:hypothetical protein, partial [Stenotrophomonas maltophilia]|uniref:hypothetical protein n=1 Tax=Stenotrophomonas maltophilia TaxID=40324 RepID=UPI0019540640